MSVQNGKLQRAIKKCKPNHIVINTALDWRIKKLSKPVHSLIKRKRKQAKRQRKIKNLKDIQKLVSASKTNKVKHRDLHNVLTYLALYRKKLVKKYSGEKYAPTLMYLFVKYVQTAKGSERIFLERQLNKKWQSYKSRYINK